MKKFFRIITIILLASSMVFSLSGCGDDEEKYTDKKENKSVNEVENTAQVSNNEINNNEEKTKISNATVSDGIYYMVLRAEDVELSAGDICLKIENGRILIGNGFAAMTEEGTYEIKGNKLVGHYDTIKYLDHSKGGETTEETINEEFDFDILEDGSLRDNYGFGAPLDNLQFTGRIYRLTEVN